MLLLFFALKSIHHFTTALSVLYWLFVTHKSWSQVICSSESHLVRGACGVGLGYACQDLLTRVESASDSSPEGTMRFDEAALLDNIVGTLSVLICQLCPSVSGPFRDLGESFPLDKYGINTSEGSLEDNDNLDLEEDAWGVAGLVYGLAHSVSALYKVGAYDAVIKIKRMLTSWLPYVDMPDQISIWFDETTKIPLYIGSCLALPYVVAFCQRVELIDDDDLNVLFNRYTFLVSELLKFKKSGTAYQNLLLASCVGVGSLLSCILNDGVHSLRLDDVKCLLDTFRCIYSNPYPPLVHLAGMFGVVNAFGAGAGDLTNTCSQPINLQTHYEQVALSLSPSLSLGLFGPALCFSVGRTF